MTFTQPKNITLTQMAQWVDTHTAVTDNDRVTQLEYIYHLVLCRAKQLSLFNDSETYDDFTLFCAYKILTRLNNTELPELKSVVNYIRSAIRPWYAEYVRAFCCGTPELEVQNFDVYDFGDYLIDITHENDYSSLFYDCSSITHALQKHLLKIPHKRNSSEWNNICVSCFLTLQDRINSAINLSQDLSKTNNLALLSRLIRTLKNRPPILFHLEETMSTYVSVLTNELIHVMSVELSYKLHSEVSPSDCLKNLVIAAQHEDT